MAFELINSETTLKKGDIIRRTMDNGNYDYFQIVGLYEQPDIYELTLPGHNSFVEINGTLPYCSKANMIALNYEIEITG